MNEKIISHKKKRILQVVASVLFLILLKVWYLTVIQIDEKKIESTRPQRKTLMLHANRGTIYDRNNIPLAINRIKYNACIYYAHIRQIPAIKWVKDENGKKIKTYPRKEHIKKISNLLGKKLKMDPDKIEDMIHSKASLLPHVPFLIKENISEKDYFELRMLERNEAGIHAEISPERFYPQGFVASDVLGYMGAISQKKYLSIAKEIESLEKLIQENFDEGDSNKSLADLTVEEAKLKLAKLKDQSYSVNDLVGKTGIECKFDESLRGIHGKKTYEIDIKGNFLKEISSSKEPINGKKIETSISFELQQFAENLLAKDEAYRDGKSTKYNKTSKQMEEQKQPFIKGGAIVVMDPKNGEVLALASYPRFNPNDFITTSNSKLKTEKHKNILKWLELPQQVANIFDGKSPICRQLYEEKKGAYEEKKELSYEYFLELILPKNSDVFSAFDKIKNIKNAIEIEEGVEALIYLAKNENANKVIDSIFDEGENHILTKERLSLFEKNEIQSSLSKNSQESDKLIEKLNLFFKNLKNNKDKILVIDLLKIMVFNPAFSDDLINKIGDMSLSQFWKTTKSFILLEDKLKTVARPIFSELVFKKWREDNQTDFLKQKRDEEKEKKIYPKPYLDYLDQMENFLFNEFWSQKRVAILTSFLKEDKLADPTLSVYLDALKKIKQKASSAKEKEKPWKKALEFLEKNFSDFDFDDTFKLVKTIRSFDELDRPLYGKYSSYLKMKGNIEKKLAAAFYPQEGFGYGRSETFRQSAPLGSIFKVPVAYSALKKHYEYLSSFNKHIPEIINPLTMTDVVKWDKSAKKGGSMIVGYSEDNKPYPRYYKGGRLPKSSHSNIGKIDIISALAQSSNPYFSILAGDFIEDPNILLTDVKNFCFGSKTGIDLPGEISGRLPEDLSTNRTGFYSFAIGQHSLVTTPLQTAVMLSAIANGGKVLKPEIIKNNKEVIREISLPSPVRTTIIEGLDHTVWGDKGGARSEVIKKLRNDHEAMERFHKLKHKMVGKTSTAEIMHRPDIISSESEKYNHIWFGGIYFNEERNWETPELVVVVYLKYGEGGKEAAPLAAEIINKYLELKKNYSSTK